MARAVINISCDPHLAIQVRELAERMNQTESELCVEALNRFFAQQWDKNVGVVKKSVGGPKEAESPH
ncbi:hypothetical protein HYR54_15550 [Candidatus Acetothermia bacterium]|nr:hypothetical protein [Candidatus Acetothermia bacterium]